LKDIPKAKLYTLGYKNTFFFQISFFFFFFFLFIQLISLLIFFFQKQNVLFSFSFCLISQERMNKRPHTCRHGSNKVANEN